MTLNIDVKLSTTKYFLNCSHGYEKYLSIIIASSNKL